MVTRYFVILLAFGVAVFQASRGHWVEASGLAGLGAGLAILRLAVVRPGLRWLAWACFAVTAAAVLVVFQRDY